MKQSSKRLLSLVLAAVLLFAAFFVYWSQIQPAYSEVQNIRSQIYSGNDFLENETAVVAKLEDTLKKYETDPSIALAVSAAIPERQDDAGAAHQISALAVSSGLAVQSVISITSSLQNTQNSQGQATADNKFVLRPLGVSSFQTKLVGSYANFKSFLEKVETNIRIMDTKSITVEELGKSSQDQYLFTVIVATYFQTN